MTSSPYINHFIQPDSIIPNPTDPQSWNRYSYVQNNPVRYTDPTGHFRVDDDTSSCLGDHCASSEEIGNLYNEGQEKKKFKEEYGCADITVLGHCVTEGGEFLIGIYEKDDFCPITFSLTQCWDEDLPLYMGREPMDIDPAEFDELLWNIREYTHSNNSVSILNASIYDTPFYDNSFYGWGRLPGTGCIDNECYDRSELNYIAQGEFWAAKDVSKLDTFLIVLIWKELPAMHWPTLPSNGTIKWAFAGYDHYKQLYP